MRLNLDANQLNMILQRCPELGLTIACQQGHLLEERRAAYLAAARTMYARDGELEFDDDAVVSYSDDAGAYVMAWRWIDDDDAGLEDDDEEGDE